MRKENTTNRERFIEKFPSMESWVSDWEKMHGAFLGTAAISFSDDRHCFMTKFERVYLLSFSKIGDDGKETPTELVLSPEAMYALAMLYEVLKSDDDRIKFRELISNQ